MVGSGSPVGAPPQILRRFAPQNDSFEATPVVRRGCETPGMRKIMTGSPGQVQGSMSVARS